MYILVGQEIRTKSNTDIFTFEKLMCKVNYKLYN